MPCQMPNAATHDDCGASAQHNLNQQQDKTHLNPTEFLCKEPVNGPVLKIPAALTVWHTVEAIVWILLHASILLWDFCLQLRRMLL